MWNEVEALQPPTTPAKYMFHWESVFMGTRNDADGENSGGGVCFRVGVFEVGPDFGHGGLSAVMKLTKLFAESGASAIHFKDQLHGGKKCGHLSGKVLVPTSTHTSRLVSARFQLDLLKSTMLINARTDAESGRRWTWQIMSLSRGRRIEGECMRERGLVTFGEAVEAARKEAAVEEFAIANKEDAVKTFKDATAGKLISDMREVAKDVLGAPVLWDYEMPRTREEYYHVTGGLGRATTFALYADLVWLETKMPDIEETRNGPEELCWEFGKEGFVLQLISLTGLYGNATATVKLAARYNEDGMLAYVQLVHRKEREIGCDVLTYQKCGANYVDKIVRSVSSGSSSTSAVGKDSTDNEL
ncbi:mitochondrial 2-methylisocitrate lyase [Marasmius sp. AFHP31]|nr:mitochondrial 2-methylisocitrate lyase [Marasmius sp. AFHP31]